MTRPSRHVDPDDRARHHRLIQKLAIGAAAVLALVVLGVFATLIKTAAKTPLDPAADRQAAASASPTLSLSPSPSPSASPSPSKSPSPTRAPTHAPTQVPTRHPAPARTTAKPPSGNTSYEGQVVTLVNEARASAGCPALTVDSRLTTAARGHSRDMATRGYFDHNTPDGVTPWTRITDAGYHYSQAAENIAEGQTTPASVMDSWMNSPPHKANILNCKLRDIGVGLAYNSSHTPYWTQDFGTPA